MSSKIIILWFALIHILVAREYGKRLQGHVIKAFNYAGPKMCAVECSRRSNCKSLNYNQEDFYCEVNAKQKEEFPGDFVTDYGYFYADKIEGLGPKEDICASVRCCPNHKCVPLHNKKTKCIRTVRGWNSFNDSCYYYSTYTADWQSASSKCISMGAHLAIVTSAEEDKYIVTLARGSGGAFWLDGSDLKGDWMWNTTGEIISYSNWGVWDGITNPSGGPEHCLNLHGYLDFKWNDSECDDNNHFICENELAN